MNGAKRSDLLTTPPTRAISCRLHVEDRTRVLEMDRQPAMRVIFF